LEDKLEFLDDPGEWFYDKKDKTLYVMTSDGGSPEGRDVRGKVTSWLQFEKRKFATDVFWAIYFQ